jgi:hypothetical protein
VEGDDDDVSRRVSVSQTGDGDNVSWRSVTKRGWGSGDNVLHWRVTSLGVGGKRRQCVASQSQGKEDGDDVGWAHSKTSGPQRAKKKALLTLHGVREGNRRKGNNANGGGDAREGGSMRGRAATQRSVGAREIHLDLKRTVFEFESCGPALRHQG